MKRNRIVLVTLAMSCALVAAAGIAVARSLGLGSDSTGIAIDATNFPDSEFREAVSEYDLDGDGKLSEPEIQKAELMSCCENGIRSLKGIEFFTNLKFLYCDNNQLEELDLSKNINLIDLSCGYNRIKSLDLTSNKKLESLSCCDNPEYVEEEKRAVGKGALESIDVSGCEKLNMMDIGGNKVSDLRLNGASGLVELHCQCNYLKELDLSAAKNLHFLDCSSNCLTALDVSKLPELETLFCDTNALTKLDVTHNPSLKELHCFENKLASLDLSKNLALNTLHCSSNQLTELDLSKARCLQVCSSYQNKISSLDIGYTVLADVYDENALQDLGTCYEFYYSNQGIGEDTVFDLSFDKTTRIESEKKGKNVCEIDEEHFPDEAFRKYVSESFDVNHDGYFSESELAAVPGIGLTDVPAKSIKGIEYFYNATTFDYRGDTLTEIDLSGLKHMRKVNIQEEGSEPILRSVNVSGCGDLEHLICFGHEIENLDLTKNPKLREASIQVKSGSYDFSNKKDLIYLMLSDENLQTLNLSSNKELLTLELYGGKIDSLDLSSNTKLREITVFCELTSLDLSHHPDLKSLDCGSSRMKTIDVSKNSKLKHLCMYCDQLSSIDLSHNAELAELTLKSDAITSVNVENNPQLERLNCEGKKIGKITLGS